MTSDKPADAGRPTASAFWRVVSWAIWVLVVVIAAATFVLFPPTATERRDVTAYVAYGLSVMFGPACSFVGALITSNRPGNRIGRLLVGLGLLVSLLFFTTGYGQTNGPAADAFNVLGDFAFVVSVGLLLLLVLLFPDGRPLSPRWRAVVWLTALWPPLLFLATLALTPEDLLAKSPSGPLNRLGLVLMFVTAIVACISAFLRFARSRGTERQQLKWFAYASTIGLAGAFAGATLGDWGDVLTSVFLFAPVAGIAVALFRHRLYDIDVLINRTFVYGSLVAILAGLYAASIQLFKVVFVALTGDESDAAIVITTLILATTFTPIKNRLEEIARRRFKEPEGAPSEADASLATKEALRAELREQARRLERLEHDVRGDG
jgi:hypothetical protein